MDLTSFAGNLGGRFRSGEHTEEAVGKRLVVVDHEINCKGCHARL